MQAVEVRVVNDAGGRVAVVFDGSQAAHAAIQQAVAIARERHGRLTVIGVAPKPWPTVAMVGLCPLQLQQDLSERAQQDLRRAVSAVPDDVPCTTIVRAGRPRREYLRALRRGDYDVLVGLRSSAPALALAGPFKRSRFAADGSVA